MTPDFYFLFTRAQVIKFMLPYLIVTAGTVPLQVIGESHTLRRLHENDVSNLHGKSISQLNKPNKSLYYHLQ